MIPEVERRKPVRLFASTWMNAHCHSVLPSAQTMHEHGYYVVAKKSLSGDVKKKAPSWLMKNIELVDFLEYTYYIMFSNEEDAVRMVLECS